MDIIEKTVMVPFKVSLDVGPNMTAAYAFDVPEAPVAYGTPNTALTQMRGIVSARVMDAVRLSAREYQKRRIVVCKDGTVLLVYHNGVWGYAIAHAERNYSAGCYGRDTYDDALADAQRHAETGFGGILWESTV